MFSHQLLYFYDFIELLRACMYISIPIIQKYWHGLIAAEFFTLEVGKVPIYYCLPELIDVSLGLSDSHLLWIKRGVHM
jgi:hypothetical protein